MQMSPSARAGAGLFLTTLALALDASAGTLAASLALDPAVAPPTTTIAANGSGFGPGERVALRFDQSNVGAVVATGGGTGVFQMTPAPPRVTRSDPVQVSGTALKSSSYRLKDAPSS